jgi:hydroxymethylpyrimidine/phosphomethylpyrimidine kinase
VNILQNDCPPVAMSIAEFDSSGQSGTIADLKTFAAHHCYGVAAVTALTLHQPGSKPRVHLTASPWLKESIVSLMREQSVRAIKVGMLCGRASAHVVCEVLDANPSVPVVLDPDLRGMDNTDDKETAGAEVLRSFLVRRAAVVTPNAAEAAALTGLQVQSAAEMKTAAAKLVEMGARSAVVTGGIFEKPFDIYFDREISETLAGERFKVEAPYGPGSTFSSAIAANLALGRHPHDAVVMAKAFVTEALRKGYITASGTILLNHFYRTQQAPRVTDSESGVPERAL